MKKKKLKILKKGNKMKSLEEKVKGIMNGREFYELMQVYRHMPIIKQRDVVVAFEEVKEFLIKKLNTIYKPRIDEGKIKDIILANDAGGYMNIDGMTIQRVDVDKLAHIIAQKAEEWIK